ncbi:uncharacterized protein LOC144101297 [Amblyomma americanum]
MESAGSSTSGGGQRSTNKSWTNEKEARLISLYGTHRLLWDSRHPAYYNKDSREHAIKAIAQGLDNEFNVVNVKDKIKSLRDYFVKELKKEAASRKSPAVRPYVSRWEHFRSWDFLRSVICCDPRVQSPPTADLPSGPLDGPHCGVKQELQEVYPVFFIAEEPDMILPSSPECSLDEDEEQPSSTKTTSLSPPSSPVPQATGSSGLQPRDHALLRPQPNTEHGSSPSSPSYPAPDSVTSPNVPPPKRARPFTRPERPQENHRGATPASCSGGQPSSVESSPVPSPVATCAASLPVGSESSNPNSLTGINIGGGDGRGDSAGDGGGDGGGGAPVPFDLDLFEERLFCRQVLMELRQMDRYHRDLAKLRIRQIIFETKYMELDATFRGQGGN